MPGNAAVQHWLFAKQFHTGHLIVHHLPPEEEDLLLETDPEECDLERDRELPDPEEEYDPVSDELVYESLPESDPLPSSSYCLPLRCSLTSA
jgi:hypothetical protein